MAVNVTASPATNVAAYNPIVWKLQISAMGVAPIEKRVLYYLADGAGTQISDTYVWTPRSNTETLEINASQVIRAAIRTAWPSCSMSPTVDGIISKTIKLYYAEADYNTSTCVDSIGAYSQTSTITVWNSSLNLDTKNQFTWTGGKTGCMMNSFPSVIHYSPDSEPYMWFAGEGSGQITFYSAAGVNLGTTAWSFTGATTAKFVSLDWKCYTGTRPHTANVQYNDGTGSKSVLIVYDACTCRGFYTGLTFLDPLGGRSHVSVLCPSEMSAIREGSEVYQYTPGLSQDNKGRSFFRPIAKDQVKVQIKVPNTFQDMAFARSILASPGHHLLKVSESGTKTWHKFILQAGTIKLSEDRTDIIAELTGEVADYKSGQTIDI